MPTYDIYVLEENAISLSGGAVLDGVTQGDGSNLNGIFITLNSTAWQPITITEPDDADFRDNDGNQRLDGPATLNGITYATNTQVEAEYGLVLSDGVNNWTVVGFNVNNSSPAYGTVEGLAFIGGPGGFPPVGVALEVVSAFEGPDFESANYATPICMASGTMVATPDGPRAVEDIAIGDAVLTRDHGAQIVRWHGKRRVICAGSFAPVFFATGAVGNTVPLILSQQHRVLIEGWQAELLFGVSEILVPALHLLNDQTVRLVRDGDVVYHHLMLDTHAALNTNGAWSESFHPGDQALKHVLPKAREEIIALFPELDTTDADMSAITAYRTAKRAEASLLRLN
jgi:hypothetical protein